MTATSQRLIYVGIDDTDNLESRGTGYQARSLARELEEAGLGKILSVTRHQLLVDPRIPYTSHNSSACLTVHSGADFKDVARKAADFIVKAAAAGSDPGLCVAEASSVTDSVVAFGKSAKSQVLVSRRSLPLGSGPVGEEGLSYLCLSKGGNPRSCKENPALSPDLPKVSSSGRKTPSRLRCYL